MTLTSLADELGLRKQDYARLRKLLAELLEGSAIVNLGSGLYALPSQRSSQERDKKKERPAPAAPRSARLPWGGAPSVKPAAPQPIEVKAPRVTEPEGGAAIDHEGKPVGRITVHPAGYGFVTLDDGRDVFVPAKYRGNSLDGDRVVLVTWEGYKGTEGRVESVVARGRARLTGTLRRGGRLVWLEPDDPRIAADHGRVSIDGAAMGDDGQAVVAEITRYPSAAGGELAGRVVKVLGDPDDPRTEIEKILAIAAIPLEFPDDAIAQGKSTPQELRAEDLADRIDLRDRRFCTIDPETARDFDDALCVEDGPHGGPRVWVAVADVSHYVRWEDALDRESTLRGVSVYLPDRVIPMLPHELSSGICSLNPDVDRCAMVVRLDYTADGELVDTAYAAAVIRSKARLDYPGVAAALGGDFRGRREAYRPWAGELERLHALSRTLRDGRRARGALELDIPEPKVVLDADDPRLVRDIIKAKGDPAVKQAYELVEEFMIAANEAVGRFFRQHNAPTVWRVHAPPDPDRVGALAEVLGAYGIKVDVDEAVTPLGMKKVLDQILDMPAARSLSFLVLRTLTQAVWDTVPVGHFGLASGDYLHFTSPIRRYPDLLVHRLLKYHLHRDGQPSGGGYRKPPPPTPRLQELAANASAQERRAMEAEREAVSMYRAYLVRDQIGERFPGVISAVTSFGAFVEIEEPFVEGLIKLDSLGEAMEFDEVHMRLRGRRSGLTLTLGDSVTVEILNVSVTRRRVDLGLVQGGRVIRGESTRERRPPPRREERGRDRDRAPREEPAVEANPRVGLSRQRAAGRAVERAVTDRLAPGTPRGGKLKLKVSHRGPGGGHDRDDGGKPRGGGGRDRDKKRR
ncbi:MAG TPA: VacB/RNase II family 3'-5' exoribonuclease [Kofleriaceae bacterium]|nr:VacB/RNase II family 3'-5' exoribonuclease [Kofleriaceae bacterium]